MRPFTAFLGFIAGSLVSMAFGLLVVFFVFWLLRNDHPQFGSELAEVGRGAFFFFLLAACSAAAFWATVRGKTWRYVPLSFLWMGIALVGRYYWPS